jgi:hypothetical protein
MTLGELKKRVDRLLSGVDSDSNEPDTCEAIREIMVYLVSMGQPDAFCAVGIDLAGEEPTEEERALLQAEMDSRGGMFQMRVIRAYDPIQKRVISRLDAWRGGGAMSRFFSESMSDRKR